jgi:hypothetical protein
MEVPRVPLRSPGVHKAGPLPIPTGKAERVLVESLHPSLFLSPQEQHPVGLPRSTGPMQSPMPPGSSGLVSGASPAGPGFLGSQPQAAIMKQMVMDQRAQFLREQRQQQQILAEQVTGPIPAGSAYLSLAACQRSPQSFPLAR